MAVDLSNLPVGVHSGITYAGDRVYFLDNGEQMSESEYSQWLTNRDNPNWAGNISQPGTGLVPPPPVEDPYGHYGAPTMPGYTTDIPGQRPPELSRGGPYVPNPPPSTQPVVAVTALIGFSMLVSRLGLLRGGSAWVSLRGLAATGRVTWQRLPQWLKVALISIGIAQGTDIILDELDVGPDQPGGGLTGLLPSPGEDIGSMGQQMDGASVTKTWTANGTPFVKLSNGKMGAMKRDGSWKFWRPKKPIVFYASGSANLSDLLRADGAVARQIKKLDKAIRRRRPVRRAKCAVCNRVTCVCKV